ncbi:MAG: FAD-dependent oxidoreductase [Geminicoccaceae bacterium]|nr:FAD-dependent oxidoreductase [Geminicoccaceae bacterium]
MADEQATYDLIIVGGGVYGILTALEATRRKLRPLLLERGAFAGATSANSLRILHGGLRYLQSLDFRRAAVSIRERAWWLREFPEATRPLACLMPLYGEGLRRPEVFRLALALNERIARAQGDDVLPPGRVIGRQAVLDLFPSAASSGLRAGALWYDGFAPDMTRLLHEALRRAESAGAIAHDRVEAVGVVVARKRVVGVRARDLRSGTEAVWHAPLVINAAGPWSARFASACGSPAPELFRPLLAWNVVFDRAPLSACALAVRARTPAAQTWFLAPRDGRLVAGTGYAAWPQGTDQVAVPDPELERFIVALNEAVPGLELSRSEVAQIDAGLLPATSDGGTVLAQQPVVVDHGAREGPAGLFSVSGVKLTTARAVAARLLDRALPSGRATVRPAAEPALDHG